MGQLVVSLCLTVFAASAFAQGQKAYEPKIGQDGKDVIWVPTPLVVVEKMIDIAQVTARDYVIDLGSGDGITVIAAAKRGARALGIEYNPDLVRLSRRNAENEGVSARAKFVKADLFESDFSQATVITLYLGLNLNLRLRPKILGLRPGTRVVSHVFTMYQWSPDETATIDGHDVNLWIVPAKVAGVWRTSQGELILRQEFQTIEGTIKNGGQAVPISGGRLRGDFLSFSAGGTVYSGRVSGNRIQGRVELDGASSAWSASRTRR